jgi:hypothetical protein
MKKLLQLIHICWHRIASPYDFRVVHTHSFTLIK